MASYTTNLNLKKPAGSENVAIGDINNNMDTIDQAVGTLNSKFVKYNGTKTTSATGLIKIMDGNPNATLTINCSPYIALPFYSNGAWYARIIADSTSFSPVANTSIEYYANIALA